MFQNRVGSRCCNALIDVVSVFILTISPLKNFLCKHFYKKLNCIKVDFYINVSNRVFFLDLKPHFTFSFEEVQTLSTIDNTITIT